MGQLKMIECKKCGFKHQDESDVALHHVVPKCIGGTDKDGRAYLCGVKKGNDCHRKLHTFLRQDNKIKIVLKENFNRWMEEE